MELNGKFKTKENGDYGSFSVEVEYRDTFKDDSLIEPLKELKAARAKVNSLESSIIEKAKGVAGKKVPSKFKVISVDIGGYCDDFIVKYNCHGLKIEGIERYRKPKPKEDKELTAIEKLARHPDIKTILNCGVLTKEEKRAVFNLPNGEADDR